MYIWFWNPETRQYQSNVPTVAPESDVGVKFEVENLEPYSQYLTPRIDMWFNGEWFSSFQGSTKVYAPGEVVKCEYHRSCPVGDSGEVTAKLMVRTGADGKGVIYEVVEDLLIANVLSGLPPPPPPDDYEIYNVQFYDSVSRKWVDFTPVGSVGTDVGISITIMNNTSNSAHFDATIRFRDAEGNSVYLIDRSGTVNPGYAGMGGPATTQTIFDSWAPGKVTAEVTIEIDGETLTWDGVIAEAAVGPPPGEADLSGKVTCAGKAVSGAYVTLDGGATHTDVSGYYYFRDFAPGTYRLEITKDGYSDYSKSVTLEEGDNTCDVSLEVEEDEVLCTPGDTKCVGSDLYVCSGAKEWVLSERDAPQCILLEKRDPLDAFIRYMESIRPTCPISFVEGNWVKFTEKVIEITPEIPILPAG